MGSGRAAIFCVALVVICVSGISAKTAAHEPKASSDIGQNYPSRVYWGDTHVHTSLSVDAFITGTTLTPDDAYRFGRGEEVRRPDGMLMRLRRPLDFMVVADHAENLGVLPALESDNSALLATPSGVLWREKLQGALSAIKQLRRSTDKDVKEVFESESQNILFSLNIDAATGSYIGSADFRRSIWEDVAGRADRYNNPGKFTTFSGYEWGPVALFTHRVVVFRDDAARVTQLLPFSQLDSTHPEDLWNHLDNYRQKTGGEVLAIPHNPNLTRGHMFMLEDSDGKPLSAEYARQRSRWEPLLEVTQIKGDSETHPQLSPTDEFAEYERHVSYYGSSPDRGRQYEYARSALKLGLDRHAALGVNPFRFGLIGSTDSHTGLSTADDDNFGVVVPQPPSMVTAAYLFRPSQEFKPEPYRLAKQNVAGYAAVWARDNTREALFNAMQRREVYATTGPRIELRFFGGWNYKDADVTKVDFAAVGYANGVPMGGELTHAPKGRAPNFLIRAVKDPLGANLDRVQIVKGWRDSSGTLHETVYNVALSDGRQEGKDGTVKPVGNTVNVEEATYINSIGDSEFATVWRDPDFDPHELAFYYVRVIEIPTPRWTAYYAKHFKVRMPSEIPMVTQERAYSSPIWYTP